MRTFTKEDSLVIKGVAILFMVFAHLFNNMTLCSLSTPLVYIGDEPLVHYLIFAMNPVDFFIILSGYGLYISYANGRRNNGKRVLRLYLHYWLTLGVFVFIGWVMEKQGYPGSPATIAENLIGWRNTYNHETWFLLPYSLLALTAPFLFHCMGKVKPWLAFAIVFSIYLAIRFASRYDSAYTSAYQSLRWAESYLTLLFPFMLGALAAKCIDIKKIKTLFRGGSLVAVAVLMVTIIALRNCFQSIFYPFYALAFIMLFATLKRPVIVDVILLELGKRSTSIWFIHTYFCYYLFQDFFYSVRYPILIFLLTVVVSFFSAIIIDNIFKYIQRMLPQRIL